MFYRSGSSKRTLIQTVLTLYLCTSILARYQEIDGAGWRRSLKPSLKLHLEKTFNTQGATADPNLTFIGLFNILYNKVGFTFTKVCVCVCVCEFIFNYLYQLPCLRASADTGSVWDVRYWGLSLSVRVLPHESVVAEAIHMLSRGSLSWANSGEQEECPLRRSLNSWEDSSKPRYTTLTRHTLATDATAERNQHSNRCTAVDENTLKNTLNKRWTLTHMWKNKECQNWNVMESTFRYEGKVGIVAN